MISKQDILDRASEWQLRPDVVEKDYIIGWLLSAFSNNSETSKNWVFKGGTCLKKCYFETYRFSEDLDFSLKPDAEYTEEGIKKPLVEIIRECSSSSGIELSEDMLRVDLKKNKQGNPTYKGRIYYKGPLNRRDYMRVLLDITNDEPIVDSPDKRPIFHPYPDSLLDNDGISTYSIEEIVAEKMRALFERTRPRDLYDIVHLLENHKDQLDMKKSNDIFDRKCKSKSFQAPNISQMKNQIMKSEELKTEWENMLAHQLPQLPSVDDFLDRTSNLLDLFFMVDVTPRPTLSSYGLRSGETVLASSGIQYWGEHKHLEIIRFAATNRLLIEFDYHGKHRVGEPYSLRRAGTGNLLLYVVELEAGHMKAFKVDEITGIVSTKTSFVPKYTIEFQSSGPITIKRTDRKIPSSTVVRKKSLHYGPTYHYKCTVCGKEFKRNKNNSSLRKHKYPKSEMFCPGRIGYLIRVS